MLKQPWIAKPLTDILFILSPPFFCLLIVMLFPASFTNTKDVSLAGWVILILLIDVGHVYSTLYRTYFDSTARRNNQAILFAIPFFSFVAGVVVYSISNMIFWRILAYIAVFHFIRQQYGFMRLYSRNEAKGTFLSLIDKIVIYAAGIYPILYWHLSGPRNFSWFVEKDFFFFESQATLSVASVLYFSIVGLYLVIAVFTSLRTKHINLPKNAVIVGTLLSWYFGIVYFNGDMAFTLLNVVSHGIPYMALIWAHGKKNSARHRDGILKLVFSKYGVLLFLGIIFLLAFVEEALWDISVWKEHGKLFGSPFNFTLDNKLLSLVVPLLAVPQITHYILDGFIWRIKKNEIVWKNEVRDHT